MIISHATSDLYEWNFKIVPGILTHLRIFRRQTAAFLNESRIMHN